MPTMPQETRIEFDDDGDGTADRIGFDPNDDGNPDRIEFDDDGDGTHDRAENYTYDEDGNRTRTGFDDDNDRTADRRAHLDADGRWERVELEVDDDGIIHRSNHHTFDDDGNLFGVVCHLLLRKVSPDPAAAGFSRYFRGLCGDGCSPAPAPRGAESVLSGPIFSGPVGRPVLV